MRNGPKQLCTSDLARRRLCRSKISDSLEATARKSSDANKNGRTTAERTTSNLPPSFLKLAHMDQHNSRSCDYVCGNLPTSPTSRATTTKLGSVIPRAPARNSVSAITSSSSGSASGNGDKPTSGRSANGNTITDISIATMLTSSGSTS